MSQPWYARLWPRSLAGQMIALLLLALVAAQAVSLAILWDERRHAVRAAERAQVLSRTLSIVRLLGETPPELSPRIMETASGPRLRYWLAPESALDPQDPEHRDSRVRARLAGLLEGSGAREVLVRLEEPEGGAFAFWRHGRKPAWPKRLHDDDDDDDDKDDDEDGGREERFWRGWHEPHDGERPPGRFRRPPVSLTLAVHLADGRWLNAATVLPPPPPGWARYTLTWLAVMAVAITLIVIVSVRRITRPLRALAEAAERLGRGEAVPPLAEVGPDDVRRTTRAFNEMSARLHRFVRDRTRMLGAISHDLRTPITSLRLRAEFVEDPEIREKILETLAEMQEMIDGVLAFVREEAAREDTRQVDLAALIASLCDDLADGGKDVRFLEPEFKESGAGKSVTRCRPVALKRALSNLIENAVTYGERARVSLAAGDAAYEITVDDDGPGIPEADLERVFEPFQRLDDSRSRETGGTGLGLAIARSILRGHGGDITLANRPGGGLRATLRLPRTPGPA